MSDQTTELIVEFVCFSDNSKKTKTIKIVVDKNISHIDKKYLSTFSQFKTTERFELTKISGLQNLCNLKSINFNVEGFTGLHDLEGIENLKNLESIDFGYNRTINSSTFMKEYGLIYHIKRLSFYESQTDNDDLLQYLPDLEELDLSYCNIGSDDFKNHHSNLKTLILRDNNISHINFIHNFKNLTKLIINCQTFNINNIDIIPHNNLEYLDISGTSTYNSIDLSVFNKFPKLESLYINNLIIIDNDFINYKNNINHNNDTFCDDYIFHDCRYNNCRNMHPFNKKNLNDNIFESSTLKYIEMSFLEGIYIDQISFGSFPKLIELCMIMNCIENLSFINRTNFPLLKKITIDTLDTISCADTINKIDDLVVVEICKIPFTTWKI
jgi:hypothetical protein